MMGSMSFNMCLNRSVRTSTGGHILLPSERIPRKAGRNSDVRTFVCGSSRSHLVTAAGRPGLRMNRATILGISRMAEVNTFLS